MMAVRQAMSALQRLRENVRDTREGAGVLVHTRTRRSNARASAKRCARVSSLRCSKSKQADRLFEFCDRARMIIDVQIKQPLRHAC
jgi:hypothetical protein